jgi:hypothetical protein
MNGDQVIYGKALIWAGVAVMVVFAGASLFFLVQNAKAGSETRSLLVECTIPPSERTPPVEVRESSRDCFTRNQERLARSVGQISDISVVAAACGAANPGDVKATRQCVEEALAP